MDDLFESNCPDLKPVIKVCRERLTQVYNRGVIINMVGVDANGAFGCGCNKKLFSLCGCIVIRCGLGCRIWWITFHTSFDFLDDNTLSMKFLLVDLIDSLRQLRAAQNFSQVSLLLLLTLAADRWRSLCSLNSAMAGSLSHRAGGRVTFVNFNGACLSIHSLINELNILSFSSRSETPKEAANGSVLKSSIKEDSSKFFKFLMNLCLVWNLVTLMLIVA